MNPLCSRILPVAALFLLPLQAAWARYDLPALEQVEKKVQAVADKARPCVVGIMHGEGKGVAMGTGTIIAKNGLVLTAAHVVDESEVVSVLFPDGKTGHAKVLGLNYTRDVALCMITEPGEYPFMELGDTKDLKEGDMVVAMGHPGGFDPKRQPPVRFGRVFEFGHADYIRSDCALVGGDSGGPLFDLDGKVIGVNANVSTDMSMNNDAPAEAVRKDWDRMIAGERIGKNPLKVETSLTPEELAGLDLGNFRHRVQAEAVANNGKMSLEPKEVAKWLKEYGMKAEKVDAMDPDAISAFTSKALEGMARAGIDESKLPNLTEQELAGLDLKKFVHGLVEYGMKNGGKLEVPPSEVAKWLREDGMNDERVKAMSDADLVAFVQKSLGSVGKVSANAGLPPLTKGMPTKEELAGLDLKRLHEVLQTEGKKNGGHFSATAAAIAQAFLDAGMSSERVQALGDEDRTEMLRRILASPDFKGGFAVGAENARKTAKKEGDQKSDSKADADLAGLDMEKFRKNIHDEGMKNGGKLEATAANIKQWFLDAGMKEERLKAMADKDAITLMQKVLSGSVTASSKSASAETKEANGDLAGLDVEKFRKRIQEEGMKNGGKLEMTPTGIKQWFLDAGMKEERIKGMADNDAVTLMQKLLSGGETGNSKTASAETKAAEGDLAGLDVEKFRKAITDEGMKNGGKVEATPSKITGWLRDAGMKEDRLKAMSDVDLAELAQKVLKGASNMETVTADQAQGGNYFQFKAVAEQDKEIVEAITPSLAKVQPSTVSLMDGDKTLALGTIVRSNGFILTKQSEIAKAKNGLKVRLADGRTLPAVPVQQFEDHDLALVKVAADSLPAVTLPESQEPIAPGSFLFTPGTQADAVMLAMGVVSVKERPLKESGGYIGISMAEAKNGVGIGEVTAEGPAAKAGLQKDDLILSIDGHEFHELAELSKYVRSLKPGDKAQVKYRRGEGEKSAELAVGDRWKMPTAEGKPNPMTAIGTQVSDKWTGFPLIFQHDQPLKPEQCGSAIVDLHGRVVGFNIARVDRVETYAIPAGTVASLLKPLDFDALEKKAAESASAPSKS
jgi:serine protease Do